jgi:hypothetical protein
VMLLSPVNPAVDQVASPLRRRHLRWSRAHAGHAAPLIPGLFGPTPHKPFAAPARPTGLGLVQSSRARDW